MMWMAVFVWLFAAPWATITMNPRAVFVGGGTNITCRVPRHPDNRIIHLGIADVRESVQQLDGEAARTVFELQVLRLPCEASEGYCAITRADGSRQVYTQSLQIVGCE